LKLFLFETSEPFDKKQTFVICSCNDALTNVCFYVN
jgi:hypothetical protein